MKKFGFSDEDRNKVVDTLNECNINNISNNLINKLSYQLRLLAFNLVVNFDIPVYDIKEVTSNLFTNEEALELYMLSDDINAKKFIFNSFDNDNKIKYCHEVFKYFYEYEDLLKVVSDDNKKLLVIDSFLNTDIFDDYSLKDVVPYFSSSNQINLFQKIFKFYKKKNLDLHNDSLIIMLKKTSVSVRKEIVEEYEKYFKITSNSFCEIVALLDQNVMLDYFFEKINNYDSFFTYYLADIFMKLDSKNKKRIIDELIKLDKLENYEFSDLFQNCESYDKINILEYIFNLSNGKPGKYLDNSFLGKLISDLSIEEGNKIFKKYVIDNPYREEDHFNSILSIISSIWDYNVKFHYLDYFIKNYDKNILFSKFNTIIEYLDGKTCFVNNNIEYNNLIRLFCEKYNLDFNRVSLLVKTFGYDTLLFLNLLNINNLLNLNEESFNKVLTMFNPLENSLDFNTLNNISNSFLQREFRLNNTSDYEIFFKFESVIRSNEENKKEELNKLFRVLNTHIDTDNYLALENIIQDKFINDLINEDVSSFNILHKLTNNYIMKAREDYVNSNLVSFYHKLDIEIKIEKNFYKKEIFKVKDIDSLLTNISLIGEEKLTKEEKELKSNYYLMEKIILFKQDPKNINDEIKPYLKTFASLLNKLYEFNYSDSVRNISLDGMPLTFNPYKANNEFILTILSLINFDQFSSKVLNDDEVFKQLNEFINKYKILGWNNTFKSIENETDLIINESMISSLLTNFYIIKNNMNNNEESLTKYIDYANCYDTDSRRYLSLLGKENYRLYASNQGSNKSKTTRAYRLDKLPNLVKMMYEKKDISLPSIDKVYNTKEHKKIRVILGNSTNMINLTYGERTGACLRVGGVFNDLFEYCLKDRNGFHIRFVDPDTNKFISRVSGIRDGNTVFLNELRYSVNDKYSDEDLYEVLNSLSSDLIDLSKNDEVKIDNVVISHDLAMEKYEYKEMPSQLKKVKNPFHGLNFNISPRGNMILLKSTNNNKLVRYKLMNDVPCSYPTIRDDVVSTKDSVVARDMYDKISIINGILNDTAIEDIPLNFIDNIIYGISGEDWAIIVDKDNNIYSNIVDKTKHKDRQMIEYNEAINTIKDIFNIINIEDKNFRR